MYRYEIKIVLIAPDGNRVTMTKHFVAEDSYDAVIAAVSDLKSGKTIPIFMIIVGDVDTVN